MYGRLWQVHFLLTFVALACIEHGHAIVFQQSLGEILPRDDPKKFIEREVSALERALLSNGVELGTYAVNIEMTYTTAP